MKDETVAPDAMPAASEPASEPIVGTGFGLSGRAAIHKMIDDWLDDDTARDLLLRHELGDATHEAVKLSPPHVLEVTAPSEELPPMPVAKPMPTRSLGLPPVGGEAFDALVPEALRQYKTGLNIALIADFNIAGRMTGLMRLINEHTIHRARCIIVNDDYLSYDKDIVLNRATDEDISAALSIVEDADVFHFGRMPPAIFGIDWSKRLTKNNALIQYFGSEIRHFGKQIVEFHDHTGIIGLSAWDYTMLQPHPLFYHINNFFDVNSVPCCDPLKHGDPVRICHATTNRAFKRSDEIRDALRSVAAKTDAKIELIEGKGHADCLAIKRTCQITVDQISSGIYGLSAIESMAMGHAVLCGMSNFALSYYPGCPVVPVRDAASVEAQLLELIEQPRRRERLGQTGRRFVHETADPIQVLRQHCWIYDLVVSGHRFATDLDEHMIINERKP